MKIIKHKGDITMPKKYHRVTIETCKEINRLYNAGLTMRQVAQILEFNQGVIAKYIWVKRKIIHDVQYIE
jgi:hypothetical protein